MGIVAGRFGVGTWLIQCLNQRNLDQPGSGYYDCLKWNILKKISELHEALGVKPPEHLLFSVAYGETDTCSGNDVIEFSAEFYILGFKKLKSGSMQYGKTKYDHDRGSMYFVKPQQSVTFQKCGTGGEGIFDSYP